MNKLDEQAEQMLELSRKMIPLLAGQEPGVQSAVLADLLSIWVLGHSSERGAKATAVYRDQVLAAHVKLVRKLMKVNSIKAYRPRKPH